MVDNIAELNRVLLATKTLSDAAQSADAEAVLEQCRSMVIEGRMPDHRVSVDFAASLGLISEADGRITISERGAAFIALNTENIYDLADEQKRLLLRSCFLQGPLRKATLRLLKGFEPSFKTGTYRWSGIDSAALDAEDWLIEHLRQIGLLRRQGEALEVDALYVKTVAAFLEEGPGWSEEEAADYYREKMEIGALGEELIVKHEINRLRTAGHKVESECVRRVSAVRANAGYDIESFDSVSHDAGFDRYIEVKSSRGTDLRFIWTENEMNVAKRLKDRYWIYFQGGIDLANRRAKNAPLLFQNPHESIRKDARFKMTPQGLIVEAKLRGAVI